MTKILNIPFLKGNVQASFEKLQREKGLLTAPSGPGLASIPYEKVYYDALQNSDIVIPDSGYMVLVWNLISKDKIVRLSGLTFIDYFIEQFPKGNYGSVFLINPTAKEQAINIQYLNSKGFKVAENACYIAPFYGKKIEDRALLAILEQQKPAWILVNIGGGVQEILGSWLKDHLSYKPAIICTGAAIAFKTGQQVNIPVWADRLYSGWLFRIMSSPSTYYKRYLDAIPLAKLLIKYRDGLVD